LQSFFIERFTLPRDTILIVLLNLTTFSQKCGGPRTPEIKVGYVQRA